MPPRYMTGNPSPLSKGLPRDDATGTVRVVVQLVGTRHRPVKGNMMRVVTVRNARVSAVATKIQRALKGDSNA